MKWLVAAALALPVLVLAALIGEQEIARDRAAILTVPLRGYDPRDLLRGHYLNARFDWSKIDWEADSAVGGDALVAGGLCVLSGPADKPQVRFLPDWTWKGTANGGCRLIVAGRGATGRFVPNGFEDSGSLQLFVPEARAQALEKTLREGTAVLSVDLAVRRDGIAAIAGLRVDGQRIGR